MNKRLPFSGLGKGYFRVIEILAILVVLTYAGGLSYITVNKLQKETNKVGELQKQTVELRDQIRGLKKTAEEQKETPSNNTQAVLENLEAFQTKFLKNRQEGRLYVINQINKLVKDNGLLLTGGISFEKIDSDDIDKKIADKARANTNTNTARSKEKRQSTNESSLYPSLEATFSVSGNYVSFRKFLYALETDKMFFVIDNLSLQTPDNEAKTSTGNTQRVASVQRTIQQAPGEITVQIGVKAYFRREENATN